MTSETCKSFYKIWFATATEPVVLVQWERSVGRPESYLLGAVVTLAVSALGYGLVVRYAIGTVATGSSPTCFKDQ